MDAIDLFRWLRENHQKFYMEFSAFSSGSIMIDILTMEGKYVIECLPSHPNEIGISNAKNSTFGHEGADEVYSNFDEVKARLSVILEETCSPEEVYGKPKYN